ncbi:MAG: FkbM family methyltransferase [Acidobacteriota bacterium]
MAFDADLDLRSWLQRIAFLTGGYEADTVRFLLDLHTDFGGRGYLLDIGANVGLIAIPFALLSGAERVIAVEAVPDNVTALVRNVAMNELGGIIDVIPFALGEESKSAFIQVEGNLQAGEGSGTANILPTGSTYDCVRQEIRVETLDALAAEGRVPKGCSVIKIDTDGYDLKVLQGGNRFLTDNRPVIFGEFSLHCLRWHGQSMTDILTFAKHHRYEVWRRVSPGWRFTRDLSADFDQDLLLVPSERVHSFERHLQNTD